MQAHEISGPTGLRARLTGWGAALMELHVPDREGRTADVVLGFDTPERYALGTPYFGCIAGRCANRIAFGRFRLEGREHELTINNGRHHLHGGTAGFDRREWSVDAARDQVRFTRTSPHGEEGYPGEVRVEVRYALTGEHALEIEMTAVSDRPTLVNFAHHSYWNLGGHASGDVLNHRLTIRGSRCMPADAELIPTGEVFPVAGTPYDFTSEKPIGRDLDRVGGYDTNFVVDGADGALRSVAFLADPVAGRAMELLATEPGLQLYTGNFLDGTIRGKGGAAYGRHAGLCLESQKWPDAIHHPDWPQAILRPGETYRHLMLHRFSALP